MHKCINFLGYDLKRIVLGSENEELFNKAQSKIVLSKILVL